ncbi:MAG: hypothetical protein KKA07_01600, partial [Bacteroidetes bacterium]|nr:hypothetical protein [Bacteroidota bacterium]
LLRFCDFSDDKTEKSLLRFQKLSKRTSFYNSLKSTTCFYQQNPRRGCITVEMVIHVRHHKLVELA